jgi:hypothetical protein
MARDGVIINSFQGGVNNVADPSLIAENEVAKATNVVLSSTGKFVSRPAFDVVTTYPEGVGSATPTFLGYWRDEEASSVTYAVLSFSTGTYLCNLSTYAWTKIWNSQAVDITTYLNRLYVISPTAGGGYWAKVAGTYQFVTLAAIPNGSNIHASVGRIFVASRASGARSVLRYSEITNAAAGTSIDNFPAANVIGVNEGDGEDLVKIVEGNNELFLFRSNSTWRLAFSASNEPGRGVLSQMSSTIGVDNVNSVVDAGNFIAVLHAGVLYQFAGYNFYPLNDYTKLRFKTPSTTDTGYPFISNITTALSVIGKYLLVYYHGSMYCYDVDFRIWTEFISLTRAAHIVEAPRGTFLASNQVVTGYGVHDSLTGIPGQTIGLVKFALEYPDTGTDIENIKCVIRTKAYDIGEPSKYKRLFSWEALVVAVNSVTGSFTPIDQLNADTTSWADWTTNSVTWATLATNLTSWTTLQPTTGVLVAGLPTSNPVPQVIKFGGKKIFKRAFFTVEFSNSGIASTSPSRLDGIVLYMAAGRNMIGQAQ